MKITAGKIQDLPVLEVGDKMILLGDERQSVELSKKEVRESLEVGALVKVFVYYNENRELEATRRLPSLEVGQVGSFRVISSGDLGAFISIGTRRDILIPVREQRQPLEAGRMALVTLQCDEKNKRLFASTRLTQHISNKDIPYKRGEEVELIIAEKIEIGRRVLINGTHMGVLFRQEMMSRLREGEKIKGYIRKIEGRDIIVSTQKEGEELIDDAAARLMEFLQHHKGYIRLNDDSDPEEIKMRLRMSKKTFKKAVGNLFKQQKIKLTRFGIKLIVPEEKETPKPPGESRRVRRKDEH